MKATILREETRDFRELTKFYTEAKTPPMEFKMYSTDSEVPLENIEFEQIEYNIIVIMKNRTKHYFYLTGLVLEAWNNLHKELNI